MSSRPKTRSRTRQHDHDQGAEPAETAGVWFHPEYGGRIMKEAPAGNSWRQIASVQVVVGPYRMLTPLPGQRLPRGFLWGDPSKQNFGLSGPEMVFGPLPRVCRDCGESFVLGARAQQQLYEVARAFIDVRPKRCQPCGRRRNAIERARNVYADTLRVVAANETAVTHLAVARAVLELVRAGGKASLDKAIGHCRRARRLGAARVAERLESSLIRVRAARQAGTVI